MKANAPDKIYIQSFNNSEENALYFDAVWTEQPESGQENIEYTRTDAFIEKAWDYLSYHLDTSKIDVNYKFDFIEEFRKYMEGEEL